MCPTAYILSVKSMKRVKLFSYGKLIISLSVAAAGICAALRYPQACTRGIDEGIALCIEVLVPSLFLFMALTAYLIASGAASILAAPLRELSRLLFRLPPESMTAILLAVLGGYPIGAGCAAMLYEEGILSESEAAKTAYIAVASGPGFLLNYIGRSLLNNPSAGNILLGAQAVGVIVTGIIVGRSVSSAPPTRRSGVSRSEGNALVQAVHAAGYATFSMCATVLLFSAVIEVVMTVSDPAAADIVAPLIEITTGCRRICTRVPLYITAFCVGFGGIAVHFQIFARLKGIRISKALFFLFRIIEGIITMAVTYIYLMIAPTEQAVFSTTTQSLSAAHPATLAGSGALILLSLCFIGATTQRTRR